MASRNAQLTALEDELGHTTERAHALATSVSEDVFLRRPDDSSWSIAECVAHLTLTTRAFLPIIDAALASAERVAPGADPTFRADMKGRLLRWMLEPPYRMRVKTPASFVPGMPAGRDAVVDEFDRSQSELVARLHAADGVAIDRAVIVSPFSEKMSYNLYSCFRILPTHQRRHLWQGEQVRARLAPETGGRGAA